MLIILFRNYFEGLIMARTAALPILTAEPGLTHYFEEIRRFPMLERQEEYMLAKRWHEHGDRDAEHKLHPRRWRYAAGPGVDHRPADRRHRNGRDLHEPAARRRRLAQRRDPRGRRFRRVAGLAGGRIPGPGDDARRERGVR